MCTGKFLVKRQPMEQMMSVVPMYPESKSTAGRWLQRLCSPSESRLSASPPHLPPPLTSDAAAGRPKRALSPGDGPRLRHGAAATTPRRLWPAVQSGADGELRPEGRNTAGHRGEGPASGARLHCGKTAEQLGDALY